MARKNRFMDKTWRLAAAGIMSLAVLGPASAQDAGSEAEQANAAPGWVVNCSNTPDLEGLLCLMSQEIRVRQTGQRLIRAQINLTEEDFSFLTLSLPHGVLFENGITLKIDDNNPNTLKITSGDEQGSYVRETLDPEEVDAMRRGSIAAVTVTTLNGQQLQVELSLAGFSKAHDLIRAAAQL
jgi:invasion protein IalB